MKEWLSSKRNRYIVWIGFCVVVVIVLLVSVITNVRQMNVKGMYPEGGLTDGKETKSEFFMHKELTYKTLFPAVKYQCYMPTNSRIEDGYIVGSVGDISFLAKISLEDENEECEKLLPVQLVKPVWGSEPKARLEVSDSGYFYDKQASYYAYTVETKISTRTQVNYTMCYVIRSPISECKLYLYTSTSNKELIDDAYDLLWSIALSVEEVSDMDAWFGAGDGTDEEDKIAVNDRYDELYDPNEYKVEVESSLESGYYQTEEGYDIYVVVNCNQDLERGVFLVEWVNAYKQPISLYVEDEEGNKYYIDARYSYSGHYVIPVGKCSSGLYYLKGTTLDILEDCYYYFLEEEQYEYLYEEPYSTPREG